MAQVKVKTKKGKKQGNVMSNNVKFVRKTKLIRAMNLTTKKEAQRKKERPFSQNKKKKKFDQNYIKQKH